jgi:hypothetical protein
MRGELPFVTGSALLRLWHYLRTRGGALPLAHAVSTELVKRGLLALCVAALLCACSAPAELTDDIEHRESTALCGWHLAIIDSATPAAAAQGDCVTYTPPDGVAVSADGADPCDVVSGPYTTTEAATVDVWVRTQGDDRANHVDPVMVVCSAKTN